MATSTSINAYYGSVKPTLGPRHKAVMEAFVRKENFSNSELANFLGWPINTVVPRTNELRNKGMLRSAGKRKCKVTGMEVMTWEAVPEAIEGPGLHRIYMQGRRITNQITMF